MFYYGMFHFISTCTYVALTNSKYDCVCMYCMYVMQVGQVFAAPRSIMYELSKKVGGHKRRDDGDDGGSKGVKGLLIGEVRVIVYCILCMFILSMCVYYNVLVTIYA